MNSEYIVTDEYVIFWGSFLSNFHYAPFKYNNIIFRSSEQFLCGIRRNSLMMSIPQVKF